MRLIYLVIMLVYVFFCFCIGVADAADLVVNPAGYVIDCSNTYDNDGCYEHPECCPMFPYEMDDFEGVRTYACDVKVNGDCSAEGLNILKDWGIFVVVVNGDPEYGCDDTSCACSWQACK